jgi:predicted ArsR family transcriptional regulator
MLDGLTLEGYDGRVSTVATQTDALQAMKVRVAQVVDRGRPKTTKEIAKELGVSPAQARAAYRALAHERGEDPLLARSRRARERAMSVDLTK